LLTGQAQACFKSYPEIKRFADMARCNNSESSRPGSA